MEFLLHVRYTSIIEKIDDMIYQLLKNRDKEKFPEKWWDEYNKLRREERLCVICSELGLDRFDWKALRFSGQLCRNDYIIFEELKDKNPREWIDLEKNKKKEEKC